MKNVKYFNFVSKNFSRAVLSGVFCLLVFSFLGITDARANTTLFEPRAAFERMWVDYDIVESGQKGMRIHLKFTVYDLKNTKCLVGIYFHDSNNRPLKDYNKRFYTTQGNVAVTRSLTPGYNPTYYEDLQLFMPYDELDLLDGSYNLKMNAILLYDDGEVISNLTSYPFTYTRGNKTSTTPQSSKPSGKLNRIWVDYDITEKGRRGMRVNVNFTATGMKGIDSYLAIYFQKRDGTPLKTNVPGYSDSSGNIGIFYSLKPGYDPAEYNNIRLFIPYEELNLNRGKHELRMDVDLTYENYSLIEHLGVENFVFDSGK